VAELTKRSLLLVGLPGAGKSTVGPLLAELLGAPFVDFDRTIEMRAGRSVARLFEEQGEAAFRALEAQLGSELLAGPPAVLAPGGGYVLDAATRRQALEKALLVYLETSPSVAARRLAGQEDRPLLKGFDRTLRLRQLLEQREAVYLEAQCRVTTDLGSPVEVAAQVAELARTLGGW